MLAISPCPVRRLNERLSGDSCQERFGCSQRDRAPGWAVLWWLELGRGQRAEAGTSFMRACINNSPSLPCLS